MFLVIFTSIFRNSDVQFGANRVNEATFYVPAMAALAVITVCFNNIAVAITFQRDSGVLKRTNGTPLPSAVVLRRPDTARGARLGAARRQSRLRSGARSTTPTSPPAPPWCAC